MLIEKFGENKTKCWYKCVGEEIKECTEDMIGILWTVWIVSPFAQRQDDNEFPIFAFTTPVEINL